MSLRDVNVEIGMDIADGPLAELDRKIDSVMRSLKGIDTSAIDSAVDEVGDLSNEFYDLERNVNNAVGEVERLDNTDLNKLDSEVKNADKGMGIFKNAVIAVGSALLALGIGATLKEFSTGAIEAAAGAQAMNAQFNTVFKGIEENSTNSLDKIAKETGMLPNRLKGSFTQMAAFAKTTGMATADSLSLTERATRAAADSAAFYDKSIEETADTIQSFLKGNYENDAALGISATETTRNAMANDLYGKSFKNLSESQKQLSLLAMVEEGNKLAGALGQAAKESDSYENQMGNLKQAWQDFLEKAGTPILDQAVDSLSRMSDLVSNIDPGPFMEFVSDGIDNLSTLKDITMAYYDTFKAVFSGDVSEVSNIWESLGIPPGIAEQIDNFTKIFADGFNHAKGVISEFVDEIIIPKIPVAQEIIGTSMGVISILVGGAMNVFGVLKSVIGGLIEGVIIPLMPVAMSVIETVFNVISPILRIAGSLFSMVAGTVKFLVSEIIVPLLPIASATLAETWNYMKPVLDAMTWAFNGIADAVEWVIDKLSVVGKAMKNLNVGDRISGFVSGLTGHLPGFEVGLGRVPYDEMPALLHKDEAVLPADEADALRKSGILKGDGTDPTLDFDGASYNSAPPITNRTTSSSVHAPVQIIVQGSDKPQETARSIKEELEGWYSDLSAIFPVVMEG